MKRILFLVCAFIITAFNLLSISQEERLILQEIAAEESLLRKIEGKINNLYDLAQRKREVLQLYEENNINKIKDLFNNDVSQLEKYINSKKIEPAIDEFNNIKTIYNPIDPLKGDLLYFKSFFAEFADSLSLKKQYLEKVIKQYPESDRYNKAFERLSQFYIDEDMNWEYIALYNNYNEQEKDKFRFWLGQAYYNVNEYKKAFSIFDELKSNSEYGFRAEFMLILLNYDIKNVNNTIKDIKNLQARYDSTEAYYNVSVLLLARLYLQNDKIDSSLIVYEKYLKLWPKKVNDDLRLEIARAYYLNGDYELAESLTMKVLNEPDTDDIYTEAKTFYSKIELERGQEDLSFEQINTALNQIDKIYEIVREKYLLINEQKRIYNKIETSHNEEEINELESELEKNELKLEETNDKLTEYKNQLTDENLKFLESMEELYSINNDIILRISNEINKLKSSHNQTIPSKIDREIALIDSARIRLKTLQFVSNLQEVTMDDFQLAYIISKEIFYTKRQIKNWDDIKEQVKTRNRNIANKIDDVISLFQQNIYQLNNISEFAFGEIDKSSEIQKDLIAEEKDLMNKRDSLVVLRQEIWENYNNIQARKLAKKNDKYRQKNKDLLASYERILNNIKLKADTKKEKYDFTRLTLKYEKAKDEFLNNPEKTGEQ